MDIYTELAKKIKSIVGKKTTPVFAAKVAAVDGEVCSVDVEGLELSDVRLRAVVNGEQSKVLLTPVVGSYVTVIDLSSGGLDDLQVLAFSEVEKVEVDCEAVVFNQGENGGLIAIEKLTEKLNGLVDSVNGFIGHFNAHTHSSPAGVTGTPLAAGDVVSGFVKTDYENEKVKH